MMTVVDVITEEGDEEPIELEVPTQEFGKRFMTALAAYYRTSGESDLRHRHRSIASVE